VGGANKRRHINLEIFAMPETKHVVLDWGTLDQVKSALNSLAALASMVREFPDDLKRADIQAMCATTEQECDSATAALKQCEAKAGGAN
jgi:hypothetical protein